MAFVKEIKQNSVDSHQSSPAYVLTFVRWDTRDTKNTNGNAFNTRDPLVVTSDATSIQISYNKTNKTPTVQMNLIGGAINYATALSPGDFVFVNLLDWEQDAVRVAEQVRNRKPINGINDGFKGFFKIQTPTKNLVTSPEGVRSYQYTVTGVAFSEFDSTFLYNPALVDSFKNDATELFMTTVGQYYAEKLKITVSVETLVQDLFQILLGKSRRSNNVRINNYGNLQYKIPQMVAQLLGMNKATHVCDLYNLITGIWNNSNRSTNQTDSKGFNPGIKTVGSTPNIYKTSQGLQGWKLIAPENWNYKTFWSILNDNLNSSMNEMFTTFRVDPTKDAVMPTIIARQKPFNNPNFTPPRGYKVTNYMDMPRWKLDPNMVFSASLYKNEALRYNFVQFFTQGLAADANANMAEQISNKNYVQDKEDIQRHGLKPYVLSSNFDFPVGGDRRVRAGEWVKIVADWVMNGHLKESGTLQCVGLKDNISVGDNLEFDNVVYHIEAINHIFMVSRSGSKSFRTTLNLSYGVDIRTDKSQTMYTEMEFSDAQGRSEQDYNNNQLLPGSSDNHQNGGDSDLEKPFKEKPFQTSKKPKVR